MTRDDAMAVALANRCFLYRYLWRAFSAEADEAFLAIAADERTAEECALMLGEDAAGCRLQSEIASFARDGGEAAARVRSEYAALFVGPAKLVAPPWESVYVCGADLLFQESTLEVRRAFNAAGYQASGYPHEADDHLATELDFMAALSERARAAYEAGDDEAMRVALSRQLVFLSEHLNGWLPAFAERLNEGVKPAFSRFYPNFAMLASEICKADAAAVSELMAL